LNPVIEAGKRGQGCPSSSDWKREGGKKKGSTNGKVMGRKGQWGKMMDEKTAYPPGPGEAKQA